MKQIITDVDGYSNFIIITLILAIKEKLWYNYCSFMVYDKDMAILS